MDRAREGHADVRQKDENLLAAHFAAGDFLNGAQVSNTILREGQAEPPDTVIVPSRKRRASSREQSTIHHDRLHVLDGNTRKELRVFQPKGAANIDNMVFSTHGPHVAMFVTKRPDKELPFFDVPSTFHAVVLGRDTALGPLVREVPPSPSARVSERVYDHSVVVAGKDDASATTFQSPPQRSFVRLESR